MSLPYVRGVITNDNPDKGVILMAYAGGCAGYGTGTGRGAAFALVLFILLVIILTAGMTI
jgi:hypothetical protein